jgi:hypothetical protein
MSAPLPISDINLFHYCESIVDGRTPRWLRMLSMLTTPKLLKLRLLLEHSGRRVIASAKDHRRD